MQGTKIIGGVMGIAGLLYLLKKSLEPSEAEENPFSSYFSKTSEEYRFDFKAQDRRIEAALLDLREKIHKNQGNLSPEHLLEMIKLEYLMSYEEFYKTQIIKKP